MTEPARVYTDGSCVFPGVQRGMQHPAQGVGGWAAVVEVGSDGWTVRGSDPSATSTRMELVAIIEAFRTLPAGSRVTLYTDATVALSVHVRWREGIRNLYVRDRDLWLPLAAEFDRLEVSIEIVRRRDDSEHAVVHRRCHAMANAEAKALARASLRTAEKRRLKRERRRAWERADALARVTPAPRGDYAAWENTDYQSG